MLSWACFCRPKASFPLTNASPCPPCAEPGAAAPDTRLVAETVSDEEELLPDSPLDLDEEMITGGRGGVWGAEWF